MEISDELAQRCKKVKLLLMDCDGVLTDGRLYFSANGEELKVFDVKDGQGLALWHQAGRLSGIISGRGAETILKSRAHEIGVRYVYTSSSDKVADFHEIIADAGVGREEVAFIGDDIGDLQLMKIVGLPVAVADAVFETKSAAFFITEACGGRGAVRELIDLLLRARSA
ncbi:MAG: HAD hydrolase family protein [Acidobacteriota bacterium]